EPPRSIGVPRRVGLDCRAGALSGLTRLAVGIVGYGRFGRFLHLAWGEQVAAVCDRVRIEAPESPARTDMDTAALFEHPGVAIVCVATEPATHAALAVEAL